MGPPTLHFVQARRRRLPARRPQPIVLGPAPIDWAKRGLSLRGAYRVFNAAEFRFFKATDTPPTDADSPYATNASLPHTPTDTFANGEWYLGMKEFDGVYESDFRPVGPNGETWVRLSVVGGTTASAPPQPPFLESIRLELRAGGVVRVHALYDEAAALRAGDFVVNATFDGSTPSESSGSPTATQTIPGTGLAILAHDLSGQSNGTTVKVRVQTRRTDSGPTNVWSEGSAVLTATADAQGPAAPPAGVSWRGSLPAEDV